MNARKNLLNLSLISKVSLTVTLLWVFVSVLPFLFSGLADVTVDLPKTRLSPEFQFNEPLGWMGYDAVGSSVVLQIVNGARISILVGVLTVLGSVLIGVPLGAASGYFGGWTEICVCRLMDITLAFPPLVLPLTIAAFFNGGFLIVVMALISSGWIGSAKIVRSQFRQLKGSDLVLGAHALGASHIRIIVFHLLPQTVAPLLIHAVISMAGAILAEAGLSFLGLGLGDGQISWGALLNDARAYLIESPHMAIFPCLAILSLVLSLNFLGEHLRVALNPRQSHMLNEGNES